MKQWSPCVHPAATCFGLSMMGFGVCRASGLGAEAEVAASVFERRRFTKHSESQSMRTHNCFEGLQHDHDRPTHPLLAPPFRSNPGTSQMSGSGQQRATTAGVEGGARGIGDSGQCDDRALRCYGVGLREAARDDDQKEADRQEGKSDGESAGNNECHGAIYFNSLEQILKQAKWKVFNNGKMGSY